MSTTKEINPEVLERLKNRNPLIILKYLLEGGEWEHNGHLYVLSDDYELCSVAWELDTQSGVDYHNFKKGKKRYLRTGLTVQGFLKMALETSIDETAILAANMTLKEINSNKR